MQLKKMCWMVVACVLLFGAIVSPTRAAEICLPYAENSAGEGISTRATNSFSVKIPAKACVQPNVSFLLMSGETVTIKASYAPFDASVDFGLIDSNGTFYYFNITTGSIDKTVKISTSGIYTLQISNNSNIEVTVSGFVNY